jgi:hypothetical protein
LALAQRAKTFNILYDPVLPITFVLWANKLELSFPRKLAELVVKRAAHTIDWKAAYDNLRKETDASLKRYEEELSNLNLRNKALIVSLEQRVAQEKTCAEEWKQKYIDSDNIKNSGNLNSEKSLPTRSRESVLKLMIAMAIDGYGYDPKALRNSQISEITDALDRLGISLDADTVRKWLNEAKELLPPQTE